MESATYFREKAAQCKRLALAITGYDDPAKEALIAMAAEFESRAAVIELMAVTEETIGLIHPLGRRDGDGKTEAGD